MSKMYNNLSKKIVHSVDLPQDLFLGFPNISMCGNQEVYISNHHGIMSYDEENTCVLVKDFQINIHGKELYISSYTRDEITIKGYINSLEFI